MTIHSLRGRVPALDAVVELGIAVDPIVADEETRRHVRVRGDQAPHQRHDRIARLRDAEDDLVARVIEREGGDERVLDEIVDAADRAHDGDGRRISRRRSGRPRPAPQDRHDHACEMKEGGDAAERGGRKDQESDHSFPPT